MDNQIEKKSYVSLKMVRNVVLFVAAIIISGNIGYGFGKKGTTFSISEKKLIMNASPPPTREVDFSLFWEVWNRLEQKYVDKSKIDYQKMMQGAISGMVASVGDPYTVYLPPKENNDFKEDLGGSFEGIGAQLGSRDDRIVVIAPLRDHPAEKAGVLAGDWIVRVNGEETLGWSVPQTVTKIRGKKGTLVKLTVVHEGETEQKDLQVTRDTIIVKSVESELKSSAACAPTDKKMPSSSVVSQTCPQVAYIKLARFGDQTNDEWNSVVTTVKTQLAQGARGIVLDLRNNPGGYLQSAIYIASEFVKSGVVVQQENSDSTRETYSVTRIGSLLDTPLVVLLNKGSASASEILAGALRDHNRAKIVGETSFGKGSIQTPEDLPDGSGIHITTARWLLPKGDQIHGIGIKPMIEVKNATGSAEDAQLNRAIEEVLK